MSLWVPDCGGGKSHDSDGHCPTCLGPSARMVLVTHGSMYSVKFATRASLAMLQASALRGDFVHGSGGDLFCRSVNCVELPSVGPMAKANGSWSEIVDLPHRLAQPRLLQPGVRAASIQLPHGRGVRRQCNRAPREGLGLASGLRAVASLRQTAAVAALSAVTPPRCRQSLVSLWDAETRISLAASACRATAIVVKATLTALKSVVLKGCLVTADALHCHQRYCRGGARRRRRSHGPRSSSRRTSRGSSIARSLALPPPTPPLHWPFDERRDAGHDPSECHRRSSVIAVSARRAGVPRSGRRLRQFRGPVRRGSMGTASTAIHHIALSRHAATERILEVVRLHWAGRRTTCIGSST